MRLYFGGGEVPSHRQWLKDNHVQNVYLSYMGLRRRTKFTKPWLVSEKFPDDMNIMVDAGAFTLNKGVDSGISADEVTDIATGYDSFILNNIGRLDLFTEFDAVVLGRDWIDQRRHDLYNGYRDRCVFVWHADTGTTELERMVGIYPHIGILQTALGERDLIPLLNMLAGKHGTKFHGLGMTKKRIMRDVNWESIGSTSWTSPMRYGDTFVWTGQDLRRYTKDYKEEARKRHRTLYKHEGFDYDKIMADDAQEIARLSLWSWQSFVDDINKHRRPATMLTPVSFDDSTSEKDLQPRTREKILLPGISLKQSEDRVELGVRAENLRRCDTCFLATRGCPGFQAGAECVYELPVYIKSREDIRDVENALISMQTQRVMFMRMVEDLEGGFADPNLSNEIDRLTRMIKMQRDGTADKFSLNISGSVQQPQQSLMDSIFGQTVVQAQGIEGPRMVDELVQTSEVFEAEVVEKHDG